MGNKVMTVVEPCAGWTAEGVLSLGFTAHLCSQVTRLQVALRRPDSWRQQVSHRVVQLGQVHTNPGSEEDNVAHQGLVLKGGSEGAVLAFLHSRPQSLHTAKSLVEARKTRKGEVEWEQEENE